MDLAKAAEYFQLKSVVSWLDSIIRGNISHSLMCSRYPDLSPMELVTHLEVMYEP